ncbi:Z1 domain-containing protein [Brachybacterium squillarum]|uniref:Z1 domain-containing protein n=1 Tax=Brachybacterium squillarum TaxID=661979 RepID=UPI002222B1D8|nr:Z1 domain-containing protein [Brachybacterium squillarum]MCW1804351.1 Z1 domain-containing protein [Brachybacterium squillarum]
MTDAISRSLIDAIQGLPHDRPKDLLRQIDRQLEDDDLAPLAEAEIVERLTPGDANDPVQRAFHLQLTRWNASPVLHEKVDGGATEPFTSARRRSIFGALALDEESVVRLASHFPLQDNSPTVISRKPEWSQWYSPDSVQGHYWNRYRALLEKKDFDPDAITALDLATTEIVERLANPSDLETWQTKGLVVGHVQSGKTANFTGVLAKAIDAGYKLVIVLTGTYENLRSQTQKRLDMELVGRENILQGQFQDYLRAEQELAAASTPEESAAAQARLDELAGTHDYASTGDIDWRDGKFLETPTPLDRLGVPWITRLTNNEFDYRALKTGLDALDFQNNLPHPSLPLHHTDNLPRVNVRLAIMKKNSSVLKKLAADLAKIRTKLEDVPTLIIDDEADQASINTKRTKGLARTSEEKERTAINGHISDMLRSLPRAQYVAYTATPFANVFVDMEDEHDVFPKDFILSLKASPDYMGARELHDLEPPIDDTPEHSNRAAFHRPVPLDSDDDRVAALREALDAFVLTGATKILREEQGFGKYRHHTMLVHESQSTGVHADTRHELEELWRRNAYGLPTTKARLRELWEEDFTTVSRARAEEGAPIPTFDQLWPYVGKALRRIEEGASPVVLVNGSKDADYAKPDIAFEKRSVWKILVGGAKLSRGFTVEGLTVSVYTRVTLAADTLMQMGRWFGYRKGYRDLVRIYLGTRIERRGVRGGVDLYEAFTSIARDEEDFRTELDQYAGFDDDGSPRALPIDVPPLVIQRMPWLKPTSPSKMHNSEITSKGIGGRIQDFPLQARRGDGKGNERAVTTALDLVRLLGKKASPNDEHTFLTDAGPGHPYGAHYGTVEPERVLELFRAMPWLNKGIYRPTEQFFETLVKDGKLTSFGVVVPLLPPTSVLRGHVSGHPDVELSFITRKRRNDGESTSDREGFAGSSKRQRPAIEHIAGLPEAIGQGGPLAADLSAGRRGGLLLSFSADFDQDDPRYGNALTSFPAGTSLAPADVAVHLSMSFPYSAAPKGMIMRKVRRADLPDRAFVEIQEPQV